MWLATDGCPAHVRDIDTGERRFSARQDQADITRIADALPEIGFMGVPVSATDMPVSVRPLYETRAQLANTTKHIQNGTAIDAVNARGMAEMCRVVAGSSEALRERASVSGFQGSISPLHWDEESLEAMRIYAEPGILVALCSMPIGGATASGTVVEITTLGHAEVLSGIAILKTMVPGAKVACAN
jgi:trimethylamine--corrinoid protein Co-methyltransferase